MFFFREINPLLIKLARSRCLDIGLLFCAFLDLDSALVHKLSITNIFSKRPGKLESELPPGLRVRIWKSGAEFEVILQLLLVETLGVAGNMKFIANVRDKGRGQCINYCQA